MKDTLRKKTVKALTYTPHKKPPVNINVDSMVSNMTKQHDKFKNNKNIMKHIHTKPPEVKKKKTHIEEPQDVKFKDKRIFVRSLETWFSLKGQRLTNLPKFTIDKLYSFIPKY